MKRSNGFVIEANYKKPPIPEGYKHVTGTWDKGFVISREEDSSEFVWIPVGCLGSNGTLDGVSFNSRFGRRLYFKESFIRREYHEPLEGELALQLQSVEKYGGFYFSRYNMSKNFRTGLPWSIKGEMPWTNISFDEAYHVAAMMECSDKIKSHLIFGAEYDSILEWLQKSGDVIYRYVAKGSKEWWYRREIKETGSRGGTNNIFDMVLGHMKMWTQERNDIDFRVVRGGQSEKDEEDFSIAYRDYLCPHDRPKNIGFRVALWLE